MSNAQPCGTIVSKQRRFGSDLQCIIIIDVIDFVLFQYKYFSINIIDLVKLHYHEFINLYIHI